MLTLEVEDPHMVGAIGGEVGNLVVDHLGKVGSAAKGFYSQIYKHAKFKKCEM